MAGLAHGCVIVTTTPQSPLPELVDGRDLRYVPPEDAKAAAHAIGQLRGDSRLRYLLGKNARLQSEQFTWSAIAQQHGDHYLAL
jgi:glycosyltransferase involved in cell wall biosynthesis